MGQEGAKIFTDCQSVLRLMQGPKHKAMNHGRVWGGACKLAYQQPNGPKLMAEMQKVKAHQVEHCGERPDQRSRRLGNEWADDRAKKAASLHPRPTHAAQACLAALWRNAPLEKSWARPPALARRSWLAGWQASTHDAIDARQEGAGGKGERGHDAPRPGALTERSGRRTNG